MFCSDLWFWGFGGFRIKVRSLFGIWGYVCVGFLRFFLGGGSILKKKISVDFCDFWGLGSRGVLWLREPKSTPQIKLISWGEYACRTIQAPKLPDCVPRPPAPPRPVLGSTLFGQLRPQSCQTVYSPACLSASPPFSDDSSHQATKTVLPRVLGGRGTAEARGSTYNSGTFQA